MNNCEKKNPPPPQLFFFSFSFLLSLAGSLSHNTTHNRFFPLVADHAGNNTIIISVFGGGMEREREANKKKIETKKNKGGGFEWVMQKK